MLSLLSDQWESAWHEETISCQAITDYVKHCLLQKEDFFSEISTEFTKRDSVNISENSLLERMATEYALVYGCLKVEYPRSLASL